MIYHYLELGANRHVVAKMLLHPVNFLSVRIHDGRKGHKVCPDSEFQVEVLRKNWILTLGICAQNWQYQEWVFLSATRKDSFQSDS